MPSLTVTLDDAAYERLTATAARRQRSPEDAAADLLRAAVDREGDRLRAVDLLDELDRRQEEMAEDEAMTTAIAAVDEARAELRARRP